MPELVIHRGAPGRQRIGTELRTQRVRGEGAAGHGERAEHGRRDPRGTRRPRGHGFGRLVDFASTGARGASATYRLAYL